ncbi:MAG: type II toxin-antitoxin system prevent-host-death family antitoxin [Deltaproteobacteria bacterium]|nr:type II toxin-antitoxin system prevent-host-death family antitoxin [Deltaproteobacteria bacterium]
MAELKAHLSAYLRRVRAGAEVVVTDRDTPIARLVPYARNLKPRRLIIRPARGSLKELLKTWKKQPAPPGTNSLEALLETRKDDLESW